MSSTIETIVTAAAPIFAIIMVFILAPVGYLTARRGDDPEALPMRTWAGILLVMRALVSARTPDGPLPFPPPLPHLTAWIGAALVFSALPYWLVRIFRPTGAFLEWLDHQIHIRYEVDYPKNRGDRHGRNGS